MMTKQDYELIASVIRKSPRSDDIRSLTGKLAIALYEQNRAFSFTKFCEACGYRLVALDDQDGSLPS